MANKIIMDVSRWQGRIDWDAVKRSGKIDGVMLRVLGSRGGKPYVDQAFERNCSGLILRTDDGGIEWRRLRTSAYARVCR